MRITAAHIYASRMARWHLRQACTFRDAAATAADAAACLPAIRAIRARMTGHARMAVREARRTAALHAHPDSEIGAVSTVRACGSAA